MSDTDTQLQNIKDAFERMKNKYEDESIDDEEYCEFLQNAERIQKEYENEYLM